MKLREFEAINIRLCVMNRFLEFTNVLFQQDIPDSKGFEFSHSLQDYGQNQAWSNQVLQFLNYCLNVGSRSRFFEGLIGIRLRFLAHIYDHGY